MVNIKTEFLREYTDQVISLRVHDGARERAPGPGQQQQASSSKQQASSRKRLEAVE